MPLYEGRHNAENKIRISDQARSTILTGTDKTIETIADIIAGASGAVALDGWYGVDFDELVNRLSTVLTTRGSQITFISINSIYKSLSEISEYKQAFITDDPAFGYCNMDGRIVDLLDLEKLGQLRNTLQNHTGQGFVVYGYGAAVPELFDTYVRTFYYDMTRQPMLWQMWDNKLIPFASDQPSTNYGWKEYYYCDYFLLHFQKHFMIERMDNYIEAVDIDNLKMMPRATYDEIIRTALKYPIKEVEIYQPGPWGAYRYKDFWDIKGLECNAWNELAGPELSILLDVGADEMINMPFVNLMQYADKLVGPYLNETYPHLFPLDAWLDDGYFPRPEPAERISMPIHNHPSTDYVKQHFNDLSNK